MEASLERELASAARTGSPLSVVMCDIDHFKAVNDTYGHQTGDDVLKAFSSLLKRRCRKSDIACRFGGEEFLLVLPGMPVGLAADWAEGARSATSTTPLSAGSGGLNITASFGVSSFPAHGQTWEELISAADAALYAAKSGGRNQVRRALFPVTVSEDRTYRPVAAKTRQKSPELAVLFGTRM
jgi:diguanylate cyclase (GGDEF)-like protein